MQKSRKENGCAKWGESRTEACRDSMQRCAPHHSFSSMFYRSLPLTFPLVQLERSGWNGCQNVKPKILLRFLLSACQCQERDSEWRIERDGDTWPGTGLGRKWECSPCPSLLLPTSIYLFHGAPARPTSIFAATVTYKFLEIIWKVFQALRNFKVGF